MYSVIILIIEITICATLKLIGINPVSNLLVCIFILAFTVTYSVDLLNNQKLVMYREPLLWGYLFRVALLFFDRYGRSIYHLPNSGADSEVFYNHAVLELAGLMPKSSFWFIALFRNIFSVIGTNRLFAQFIVLLFSIVALCTVSLTIDDIQIDADQKIRAVTIVSLLPNFAILSAIFLRESIVTMFITVSFYLFMRYYHGKSFINIILCFISVVIAMLFHSGSAGLIIGYVIVLFLNGRDSKEGSRKVLNIGLALLFSLIATFLYIRYGDVFFQKLLNVDSITNIANTSTAGGSSYARYVGNSNSIGSMIRYTGPRIIFFLFSPFPWQWRGVSDIIAFLFSGLYYLVIVFRAFHYIFTKCDKNRLDVIYILLILTSAVFVFAWGVSNTGTAARHRDKMVCIFAVLHAICINPDNIVHITIDDRTVI